MNMNTTHRMPAVLLVIVIATALALGAGAAFAAYINCTGGPCVGTKRVDSIVGTIGHDEISGRGGNDSITGDFPP